MYSMPPILLCLPSNPYEAASPKNSGQSRVVLMSVLRRSLELGVSL